MSLSNETQAYMDDFKGGKYEPKEQSKYGREDYLGLQDTRTRLGTYTIVFLFFILGAFVTIGVASATLLGKIYTDDKGKEFKNSNSDWVNGTSSVAIAFSALFVILSIVYIWFNKGRFEKEDAALTDIGRIGLAPLEENEVHNSLTDLVANRANLNDTQRAQLRENIGAGFKISNSRYIQRQLAKYNYGDVSQYQAEIKGLKEQREELQEREAQLLSQIPEGKKPDAQGFFDAQGSSQN